MKRIVALIFVAAGIALVGCANMTPTQQRALSGGAIVPELFTSPKLAQSPI